MMLSSSICSPLVLLSLVSVSLAATSQHPLHQAQCLSATSGHGAINYQACCDGTTGATPIIRVETVDQVPVRYTCSAWMSAYDTKGQPAHSAADCARLCLQDTSCAASTWQSSRSRCYRTARPATGSPDPVVEVNEDDGRGYVALQPLGEAADDHDRLDQVCQSRVDAALAPVQDRVRQCDSFIEGNYTLLDHTTKDINDIPVGQAETVIAGGGIWKTYYFQRGGGGASMDYTDQISTVPECLKWCVQRAADGCVRADLSPDAPQCRLFKGWNTATPGRGNQGATGTHSSVFVAKA